MCGSRAFGSICIARSTRPWLEWQDWGNPFLTEPFVVHQGAIQIPDRPGAGIEWDEAAIKRFAV